MIPLGTGPAGHGNSAAGGRYLFAVPLLVLFSSYAYLAKLHGTLDLFSVVTHEGGDLSLLGTIFYFEHFLREVPVSLFTAVAVAISVTWVGEAVGDRRVPGRWLAAAGLFFLLALATSMIRTSPHECLVELLQYRTRGSELRWGSHWHYHLLQLPFVFSVCLALGSLLRRWLARSSSAGALASDSHGSGPRLPWVCIGAWWIALVLFTGLFRPDRRPFSDPTYLAHQIREMWTALTFTIPLAFAAVAAFPPPGSRDQTGPRVPSAPAGFPPILRVVIPGLVAASIAILTWSQLRHHDILALAQKRAGYLELLSAHYFEHVLDGVWVALLAVAFCQLPLCATASRTARRASSGLPRR